MKCTFLITTLRHAYSLSWGHIIKGFIILFVIVQLPSPQSHPLARVHLSSGRTLCLFPCCLPIFPLSCPSIHPPDGFGNRFYTKFQSSSLPVFCSPPPVSIWHPAFSPFDHTFTQSQHIFLNFWVKKQFLVSRGNLASLQSSNWTWICHRCWAEHESWAAH